MKRFMKIKWILLLFIMGGGLRLILATIPGFSIDVNDWFAWSMRLHEVGFSHFYSDTVFSDYPPGYMYVLSFLAIIKDLFHLNSDQFYYLLKIPAIVAEMILAALLFWIIQKERSRKGAYLATIFIVFNPALIFITAIWGQIDAILGLLLVLSIYSLKQHKLLYASTFYVLAFLIKPQAIALGPVFLLYLLKNFNRHTIYSLLIPGIITAIIIPFPFFPHQFPVIGVLNKFVFAAAQYPYTSLFAYNIWGIVGFWMSDLLHFGPFTYQLWSIILFALYWIILGYLYLRKKIDLYSLSALALLGFYFLPTRVHERYLYPAIPFLILAAAEIKSTVLLWITGIESIVFFFSLYYVYMYYTVFYFHNPSGLLSLSLYTTLENNGRELSVIASLLFILLTFIIAKPTNKLPKNTSR